MQLTKTYAMIKTRKEDMQKQLTPLEEFVRKWTLAGLSQREIRVLLEPNGLKPVSRPRIYQIQEALGLRKRKKVKN